MDTQEEKFPPRQSIAEWFASLGLQEDAKSERFMAQLMKVFSRNKYGSSGFSVGNPCQELAG